MPIRSAAFLLHDRAPDAARFLDDVVAGLAAPRKSLPPKYFYDERGSRLFEEICSQPEYYLTRAETALMEERAGEMARCLGPGCVLIEHGSGSARKTRILLRALRPAAYVPVDISRAQLRETAAAITREFPEIEVVAVCADYLRPLALPALESLGASRRAVYFPGSTIGNLDPAEAVAYLRNARRLAGAGGGLLIGVDLKKDPARLHAAYNDRRGVTARFNLNLLERINRELGADFDLDAFRHRAFYDEPRGRIEMHLQSLREQRVRIAGRVVRFREGETIHTENSYKYSIDGFHALAGRAGLAAARCWVDADNLFSVHHLVAERTPGARRP